MLKVNEEEAQRQKSLASDFRHWDNSQMPDIDACLSNPALKVIGAGKKTKEHARRIRSACRY